MRTRKPMLISLAIVCTALVVIFTYLLLTSDKRRLHISTQDLVSCWRAEGDGSDIVGTNDGALVNGVGFRPGKLGQAFSFDGVDDYVDDGDPGLSENYPFSVLAWFKPENTGGTIYGEGSSSGRPRYQVYQIWLTADHTIAVYAQRSGSIQRLLESKMALNDGRFHHLAVVHQARDDHLLYVDGTLVDASDVDIGTRTVSEARIGSVQFRGSGQGEQFWKGLIDEVLIYRRPVSAGEIKAISGGR